MLAGVRSSTGPGRKIKRSWRRNRRASGTTATASRTTAATASPYIRRSRGAGGGGGDEGHVLHRALAVPDEDELRCERRRARERVHRAARVELLAGGQRGHQPAAQCQHRVDEGEDAARGSGVADRGGRSGERHV